MRSPSGTRVGLLVLLVIRDRYRSDIKLFADDAMLSGLVHNFDDLISLQCDLDKVFEWAKLWQMVFGPSKCYVLRVYRSMNPLIHPYTMLGQTLQSKTTNLILELLYQRIWNGGHIF